MGSGSPITIFPCLARTYRRDRVFRRLAVERLAPCRLRFGHLDPGVVR